MSNDVYIPRDDESEAKRFRDINGVGEPSYMNDEDVKIYALADFGIGFDDGEDKP